MLNKVQEYLLQYFSQEPLQAIQQISNFLEKQDNVIDQNLNYTLKCTAKD